ncbi:MAG: ROK family protein [Candidatus Omnitrophica bacterium]|nr:ROK family protein [Candidatus Omnitrophota bacterium]
MKPIIGIDIGGTKISICLAKKDGAILEKKELPTRLRADAKTSIKEIIDTVNLILFQHRLSPNDIVGIGVSVPGAVSPEKGVIPESPNLPGWKGVRIKDILRKKFRRPVFVNNDANASALAEKLFGIGGKVENFVYVTVSTGIGSGIILSGKLLNGASFSAGEIGHTTIIPGGPQCNCGKRGCLEALSSGTAIAAQAKRMMEAGKFSELGSYKAKPGNGRLSAEIVADAAREGDPLAVQIMRNAGHFLGIGLANVINILNPEIVVLGGGVMKAGDLVWKSMEQAIKREAWPGPLKVCKIMRSKLGEHCGDLGAISLVLMEQ